jgi:hypothetical protein
VRNEVEIQNHYLAALFHYLTGGACIACKVSGTGQEQTVTWVFESAKFDAEAIEQDFSNPETTVVLSEFLKALNQTASFRNAARRSLEGRWHSHLYSQKAK